MPPKQQQQKQGGGSKVAVDKTFGLKNKNKSAKVKQHVAQMQVAATMTGKSKAQQDKERENQLRAKEKLAEEKRAKEEAALFKPAQTQKVPFGVDPKTVLCAFFKAGSCEKGTKCKFSHDINVGRKVEKKNLYEDTREEKLNDTMDTWDEAKLAEVVLSKSGNLVTTTDIVCKHFVEAIESQKFGWFWDCPNGEACKYRHALPPGFVLRSQRKAAEEAAKSKVISLEEFLEVERHKLGPNLTPVTPESFAKWKRTRMDKKEAEQDAQRKAKETTHSAGKNVGMSGRDLFQYNPEWFENEDEGDASDDWDLEQYRKKDDEEEERDEDDAADDDNGNENEVEGAPEEDQDDKEVSADATPHEGGFNEADVEGSGGGRPQ